MISTAYAQAAGGSAGGDMFGAFLPLILIFVVFYFLLIRPQQKKQKEHQQKLKNIRRGDKILTGGGFYATVTKVVDDNKLQVELAEGIRVNIASGTVMDVLSKTEPANSDEKPAEEKKGLGALLGGKKKD